MKKVCTTKFLSVLFVQNEVFSLCRLINVSTMKTKAVGKEGVKEDTKNYSGPPFHILNQAF